MIHLYALQRNLNLRCAALRSTWNILDKEKAGKRSSRPSLIRISPVISRHSATAPPVHLPPSRPDHSMRCAGLRKSFVHRSALRLGWRNLTGEHSLLRHRPSLRRENVASVIDDHPIEGKLEFCFSGHVSRPLNPQSIRASRLER